jgi:hypothetical protein
VRAVKLEANMFVELMPNRKLEVGLRVLRLEHCVRCKVGTGHLYTLLSAQPRTWQYKCLQCSQRLRDEEG